MKLIAILLIAAAALPAFATDIVCGGAEPFWSLTVTNRVLRFTSPEGNGSYEIIARSTTRSGDIVVRSRYTTATIVAEACEDGASDETRSYSVNYNLGGEVFVGCCN